jgi:hypothetical protein
MTEAYTILFKSIHKEKPTDIDTHNDIGPEAGVAGEPLSRAQK